eukprot:scaffold65650_cov63-Phaeocystis_antarctica.AAC.1
MNTRSQWGGKATERSAGIQPGVGCRTGVALGRASSAGSVRTAARSSRRAQEAASTKRRACAMGLRMHTAGWRCGVFGVGSAFNQTDSVFCLSVILSV